MIALVDNRGHVKREIPQACFASTVLKAISFPCNLFCLNSVEPAHFLIYDCIVNYVEKLSSLSPYDDKETAKMWVEKYHLFNRMPLFLGRSYSASHVA